MSGSSGTWGNCIRHSPPYYLLPVLPANPVEGLVKADHLAAVLEHVQLRISRDQPAEAHTDETYQHAALV